jgi:uncharacterized phiE125 gp8 family phage protein
MALSLITGPTAEPLSIAEAKKQLLLGTTAGEPAPTAPTVTLVAAAGNITAGAHRYLVTCITADGETEAGVASSAVTTILATHGQVALTAIPLGGSAVTQRKLYRTAAGGSTYLWLATLSNNTATTYTDNIADTALGAQAPTVNTTSDPEITSAIAAARDRAELATGRALLVQTWDLVLDAFPADGWIEIPKPPLVPTTGITSLQYRDTAGTLQTWAATNYVVEAPAGPRARCGRLSLAYGVSWPSTYGQAGDVTVRFVCGYATAAAFSASQPALKAAMLLDLASVYQNREGDAPMSETAQRIYRSYKAHSTQRRAA